MQHRFQRCQISDDRPKILRRFNSSASLSVSQTFCSNQEVKSAREEFMENSREETNRRYEPQFGVNRNKRKRTQYSQKEDCREEIQNVTHKTVLLRHFAGVV